MAKSRRQKLEVYRTPIGFHDVYVSTPSQRAALEAWGSDANLFARGTAEEVDDPELARPGEVIKVLRGSETEQLRALDQEKPRGKEKRTDKPKLRVPRPNRAAVEG